MGRVTLIIVVNEGRGLLMCNPNFKEWDLVSLPVAKLVNLCWYMEESKWYGHIIGWPCV